MMQVHDRGKLALLIVTVVGAVVLLAIDGISEAAGVGIIGTALGYLTGNGRLARNGERPSPAIGRRPDPHPDPHEEEETDRGHDRP